MRWLAPLLSVAAAVYVLWVLFIAKHGLQPLEVLLTGVVR